MQKRLQEVYENVRNIVRHKKPMTLKRLGKITLFLLLLPIFGTAYALLHIGGKWWESLLDED